jgi:hypothetical protein
MQPHHDCALSICIALRIGYGSQTADEADEPA